MGEAFKEVFCAATVEQIAEQLAGAGFDRGLFVARANDGLETHELKGRVRQIADALAAALPPFAEAVPIVRSRLPPAMDGTDGMSGGFRWWPLCTWVEVHGLDHPGPALSLLEELTRRFSAEFAVRPYLRRHPELAWAAVDRWTRHPDPHVRRLASEGTRPRLPWGGRLSGLVDDPSRSLPVLEALVDDPDEVVRRSVANHLGDIAKDHPSRAVAVAAGWIAADASRRPTARHALRYLVKHGHPEALALFGFGPPALADVALTVHTPAVALGQRLQLTLAARSIAASPQPLRIELGIAFRGANDELRSPMRFTWTTRTLDPGASLTLKRGQALRAVTTRTHHPGEQGLVVFVNGEAVARGTFSLSV